MKAVVGFIRHLLLLLCLAGAVAARQRTLQQYGGILAY